MQFKWDENKDRTNKVKHGVSFETATRVWNDPHVWTYFDRSKDGEAGFHALGIVEGLLILTVVHTYRDEAGSEIVRIKGARKATRYEKSAYEHG